jgi:Putative 2OG-Fe(II) oxygenase
MPDGTIAELESSRVENEQQLQGWSYFPSSVYTIEKLDFLKSVKELSDERLKIAKANKKLDPIYPVVMTDNLFGDPRVEDFMTFAGSTAWYILENQGYAMDGLSTTFTELWTQEHYKHSLMEQHIHGSGVQLVGFYFLDVPEKSSMVTFHDPRAGKVQLNMPESNKELITSASTAVSFTPKPGLLIFSNAWLPHSFGRHASNKPLKFVHFNIAVKPVEKNICGTCPPAEIV